MKKMIALTSALVMILLLLSGCGGTARSRPETVPVEAASAAPMREPEPGHLSAQYAQWLQSGTYYYSLTADTGEYSIDITAAGKGGWYYARMDAQGQPIRQMVVDGVGYAVYEPTGEMDRFDPASEADVIPDFSTLTFKATAKDGGKVTDTYTYKMLDGTVREHIFVFENEKLTEMTTPEVLIEGTWPVSALSAEPPAELFEIPVKNTLVINEIAEGTYIGTLSGDSWANNKGTMFTTIPSAELTVTVQDGQVTLYCEAQTSADGEIGGVATPHSPEYTVIVSGAPPLAQSGDTVVSAEGEVPMLGESLSILYDAGGFTRWEVKERSSDSTYHCTVSITMVRCRRIPRAIAGAWLSAKHVP